MNDQGTSIGIERHQLRNRSNVKALAVPVAQIRLALLATSLGLWVIVLAAYRLVIS